MASSHSPEPQSNSDGLTLAQHTNLESFYEGGHYELNLSFETLREKQWQHILDVLWEQPHLFGPLAARYYPNQKIPARIPVQVPPPTATMAQHGQLRIGEMVIGCDVQATRSLFECVSILIPVQMFASMEGIITMKGATATTVRQSHPALQALDSILYDIALNVYDAVPYKIAAIGYERECQLPMELRGDGQLRHAFLVTGNFFAQADVLQALEPDLTGYEQVRENLHWRAPHDAS